MKFPFLLINKKKINKTDEALRQFQSRLEQVATRVAEAERRELSRHSVSR